MTFGLLIKYGCQYTYDAKHAQVIIDAILSIELCNIIVSNIIVSIYYVYVWYYVS